LRLGVVSKPASTGAGPLSEKRMIAEGRGASGTPQKNNAQVIRHSGKAPAADGAGKNAKRTRQQEEGERP
jgi:hypothetical protein